MASRQVLEVQRSRTPCASRMLVGVAFRVKHTKQKGPLRQTQPPGWPFPHCSCSCRGRPRGRSARPGLLVAGKRYGSAHALRATTNTAGISKATPVAGTSQRRRVHAGLVVTLGRRPRRRWMSGRPSAEQRHHATRVAAGTPKCAEPCQRRATVWRAPRLPRRRRGSIGRHLGVRVRPALQRIRLANETPPRSFVADREIKPLRVGRLVVEALTAL